MKITYSVPGKVILSGEHSVVYGKPALVTAINLRLKFSLTILERSSQDGNSNKEIQFISSKVKNYLKKEKINFVEKRFNFKIESEIPVGRGLGSSAALSVASVATFLEFYTGRQFEKEIINDLAFQIEKHFHKNPSGADNSAACYGGLILYQKQISLKNLNFKIPKNIGDKLFLIDSGQPKETTGEMVDFVSNKIDESILTEIEKTVNKLVISIQNGDAILFKKSLINNEKLLEKIEVVSKKTKKLLVDLSRFGCGKITGAGGYETNSGFLLFFAEDKEKLLKYLSTKKILYYKFTSDNQGLKRI
ncbi:MAG: hypothetical protein AAB788_00955 [Patescibacteria group bacterium]